MRATTLTAALVAALAITATSATPAKAQVIVSPGVTVSPYGVYPTSYYYPTYSYGYNFVNPYTGSWSYGWSNPWNYGNFAWYNGTINPLTTARPYGFMSWPNYVYRGWNGRFRQ